MSMNKDLRAKYRVKTKSSKGTIILGETQKIDYKLLEDLWLSGVKLILENHSSDDVFSFNVVDKDFLFKGDLYPSTPTGAGIPGVEGLSWETVTPNGVHLDDFGTDLPVCTDTQSQGKEEAGYWACLKTGMYIEIKYTSTGATDVKVRSFLYLHKEK